MEIVPRYKPLIDSMTYKRDPKLVRRETWAKFVLLGVILIVVLYGITR